jgi:hypothetical protein
MMDQNHKCHKIVNEHKFKCASVDKNSPIDDCVVNVTFLMVLMLMLFLFYVGPKCFLFQPLNEINSKLAAKLLTWELQQLSKDVKDWEVLCVSGLELQQYAGRKDFEHFLRNIPFVSARMKKAFDLKKLSVVLDDYGARGSWELAEELHSQGISTFVTSSHPISLSIQKGLTELWLGLGCIPLRVGSHISIQINEAIPLRRYFTLLKIKNKNVDEVEMYTFEDFSGSKTETLSLSDLCKRDVQYDEDVMQDAPLCIWDGAKWIEMPPTKPASIQENCRITMTENFFAQKPNRWNHFVKTVENLNIWENVLYEFVNHAQKGAKYAYDAISNMKLELESQAIYLSSATDQNDKTCDLDAKQLAKMLVCDERGSHRLSRATGDHFNVGILVIAMPGKIQF